MLIIKDKITCPLCGKWTNPCLFKALQHDSDDEPFRCKDCENNFLCDSTYPGNNPDLENDYADYICGCGAHHYLAGWLTEQEKVLELEGELMFARAQITKLTALVKKYNDHIEYYKQKEQKGKEVFHEQTKIRGQQKASVKASRRILKGIGTISHTTTGRASSSKNKS